MPRIPLGRSIPSIALPSTVFPVVFSTGLWTVRSTLLLVLLCAPTALAQGPQVPHPLLEPAPGAERPQDAEDLRATASAVFGFALSERQMERAMSWNTRSLEWWTEPLREKIARSILEELYEAGGLDDSPGTIQSHLQTSDDLFGVEVRSGGSFADDPSGPSEESPFVELVIDYAKRPDLASVDRAIFNWAFSFQDLGPEKRGEAFGEAFPEIVRAANSPGQEQEGPASGSLDIAPFEASVAEYIEDYTQRLGARQQLLVDAYFDFHRDKGGALMDRRAFEILELRSMTASSQALASATQKFLDLLPSMHGFAAAEVRRMLLEHAVEGLGTGFLAIQVPNRSARTAMAAEFASVLREGE